MKGEPMKNIEAARKKAAAGERLSLEDALALYEDNDLLFLADCARSVFTCKFLTVKAYHCVILYLRNYVVIVCVEPLLHRKSLHISRFSLIPPCHGKVRVKL